MADYIGGFDKLLLAASQQQRQNLQDSQNAYFAALANEQRGKIDQAKFDLQQREAESKMNYYALKQKALEGQANQPNLQIVQTKHKAIVFDKKTGKPIKEYSFGSDDTQADKGEPWGYIDDIPFYTRAEQEQLAMNKYNKAKEDRKIAEKLFFKLNNPINKVPVYYGKDRSNLNTPKLNLGGRQ